MREEDEGVVGVTELPGSRSPMEISKVLKEVSQMDKEVLIDHSHHSLTEKIRR